MIKSVTRKEYYFKAIFILVAITLASFAIIYNSNSVSLYIVWPIAIGIAFLFLVGFLFFGKESRQRKIVIENENILIYNLLAVKPISLKISDILSSETKKQKLYTKSGVPINDGFLVTQFKLTQKGNFVISQDQYVNYSELVHLINSKLKNPR